MQCGVMKRNELSKSRTGETIMDKTINSINGLAKEWHGTDVRSEVIFKKSSNLYCRLDLGRVLMVGTKVSKGFFV